MSSRACRGIGHYFVFLLERKDVIAYTEQCFSFFLLITMYFTDEGDDDDDQKPTPNNDTDHPAGAEAGDYAKPDDFGERVGESETHNPATLADE
jgi:hypothetical protein